MVSVNAMKYFFVKSKGIGLLLSALIAVAVFVLFHFYGNTSDSASKGSSAFVWMVGMWRYPQYDFSHGWMIPFVSMFVLWKRRRQLAEIQPRMFPAGLLVVIASLLLHFVGYRTEQTRLSLFALVLLSWGIPLYLAGPKVAGELVFPCAYLLFCIPFTFLDSFSFRLRMIGATASAFILNGINVPTCQVGTSIRSAEGLFSLDVADPCSGLKYFIAMAALTAVYAYFTQATPVKRWTLFLGAIPIAVAANITRIIGIALVARMFGQDIAVGLYHDWSGYIFFAAAVALMIGLGTLLDNVRIKSTMNAKDDRP
jgi:exosortase